MVEDAVIVDTDPSVPLMVLLPVTVMPPVVTVNPAATVMTPAFVNDISVLLPAALRTDNPLVACTLMLGWLVLPLKSISGDVPFSVRFPLVIVAPPLATVSPVKPVSVPVMLEFPVMLAPPEATVNPVNPVSVPVMVELPVIEAPLADTVMPAENVCKALKVCAVPLCAAYVLIVAILGLRYVPNKSARSVETDGTARLNGLPVVVAGTSRLHPFADHRKDDPRQYR